MLQPRQGLTEQKELLRLKYVLPNLLVELGS